MSTRSQVAVLRTRPETVLQDYERLAELAGMKAALNPGATTIIKDNISWHYPMPGANTTPWQLEGAILALRHAGFTDLVAVQNKTVVVSAFKGQDLNHYVPIFQHYDVPVLFNFKPEDMQWIKYQPKGKLLVVEPKFHVSASSFEKTRDVALLIGLKLISEPSIRLSRSMLLQLP